MSLGKLHVTIVRAINLKNKEVFMKSDPYVKLEFKEQHFKTRHIDNNLNPEWNEQFVIEIKPGEGHECIALSLWDTNTLQKDFFMGYSFLSFDDCRTGEKTQKVSFLYLF
jgi:classical protein kinase C gamma type